MNQETSINEKRVSAKAHITPFFFLLYFFALQLFVMPALFATGLFSSAVGSVIASGIIHLIPLVVYLLFTRQHPKAVLPTVPLGMKNGIYIAVTSLAVALIVLFVNFGHFNTIFSGIEPEPLELPGLSAIWIPLIAHGVLTASFEELWFRGPIYREYQRRGVSTLKTAVIGGLLFGIVHAGFFQASYTALLGVLWAYMLYYTRSIWAPILAHVVFNSLFILLNPAFYLNDYNVFWDIIQIHTLIIGISALVMTPIAVVCMKKLIANNPREKEIVVSESKSFTLGFWVLIIVMLALGLRFLFF